MTEDQNPYIHPAQARLIELIDEAEKEMFAAQDKTQPLSDPLERFHVASAWGVDPWVAAMLPVSQELAALQNLAVGIAPDEGVAKAALMSVVTHSLQALVLFEEEASGDQALDDDQLADFLGRLVTQLDARIDKLRREPEQVEEDDHSKHVHVTFANMGTSQTGVPLSDESRTRPVTTVDTEDVPLPDEDVQPGLAFTAPYGSTVAGEGNDGTPAQAVGTFTGQAMASGWLPPIDDSDPPVLREHAPGLVRVQEVPEDETGHDFRPVDLDGAERALAREAAALRQSAGGSSASSLGGRHASPEDTQPDMGETGRRAKES